MVLGSCRITVWTQKRMKRKNCIIWDLFVCVLVHYCQYHANATVLLSTYANK